MSAPFAGDFYLCIGWYSSIDIDPERFLIAKMSFIVRPSHRLAYAIIFL